ncbi:MAG: alpha/beta hydrolase [Vicinamibacterales bacterium]
MPDLLSHARTVLGVCLLAVLLSPVSASLAQGPVASPQPLTLPGAVTHVYKTVDGHELRLHAFLPPGVSHEPRPAIVFFFGGGWVRGSVEQLVPQSRHLAQRGMVAIVADYRVYERHGTWAFEAIADAKSAIRWVRAHAAELGVDPRRIAAGGSSAGGHLALSAGIFDDLDEPGEDLRVSSRPDALVLFNPVVDADEVELGPRWQEGSPLHRLKSGLPPMVILHGEVDTTVPFRRARNFCSSVAALGNRCDIHMYEGAEHGFISPRVRGGLWHRETLLEADRFLTTLGYLPAPSPDRMLN